MPRGRRAFKARLARVRSEAQGETWFESDPETGHRRGVDSAIRRLAATLQQVGVSYLLTSEGYRYYLSTHVPRLRLPQLAASFVTMFYFGSITRYRPADSTRIHENHTWLVSDFLENEPTQFLYGVASFIAEIDVVVPLAITRSEVE